MITIDTIGSERKEGVHRQVAEWLAANLEIDGKRLSIDEIDVRETISCWTLRRGFSEAPLLDERAFEEAGYWHQVFIQGVPAIVARSTSAPDGGVTVRAGGLSPAASRFDETLKWLREHEGMLGGNYLVRVLIAAGFYVHALWLSDEGSLVVPMDADQSRLRERLRDQTLYKLDEFMTILVDELRSRRGVEGPPR